MKFHTSCKLFLVSIAFAVSAAIIPRALFAGNAGPIGVEAKYYTCGTVTTIEIVLTNVESVPVILSTTDIKLFQRTGGSETLVHSGTAIGGTVPAGTLSNPGRLVISIPQSFTFTMRGEYRMEATIHATNDIDPSNDTNDWLQFVAPGKLYTQTSTNNIFTGLGGDPVGSYNGEFFLSPAADLNLGGPNPVLFQRYYASKFANDNLVRGTLGVNWSHNFDYRLYPYDEHAEVVGPTGAYALFENVNGTWACIIPEHTPYQLLHSGSKWIFFDPLGNTTYTFNADGNLTAIADRQGNQLALTYNIDSRLETVTDGLGRALTFAYAGGGKLASVTDGVRTATFAYTGNNLTSAVNPAGHTTTYTYADPSAGTGLLESITYPEGNTPFTNTWAGGKVVAQEDAYGNVTAFSYPAQLGGETVVTDAASNSYKEEHDVNGQLLSYTDELGGIVSFAYDSLGRRIETTDRNNNTVAVSYHAPSGKVFEITDANGGTLTKQFQAQTVAGIMIYEPASITWPDGTSETSTYNSQGLPVQLTDRDGNTWSFTYNTRGQIATVQAPGGGTTTYSYHASGDLAGVQDPEGNTTTYSYDNLFRMTASTSGGLTTGFVYDAMNRLIRITDPASKEVNISYDDNGNIASLTDREGLTTSFTYDNMDRRTAASFANGTTVAIDYDQVHGPYKFSTQTGTLVEAAFDARGWISSYTEGDGKTTQIARQAEGRISGVTGPLNRSLEFAYDANGNVTHITTPMMRTMEFSYTSTNRIATVTGPVGGQVRLERDDYGRISSLFMPGDSISASFVRNGFGEVTAATDANGNAWTYTYDDAGRLTGKTDPAGNSWSYEYNSMNRLSRKVLPGSGGDVAYSYDNLGRISQKTYSQGGATTYAYDANGNLTATEQTAISYDNAGQIDESNGIVYTRDANGRITGIELAQGKSIAYTYDAAGKLTQIDDWDGGTVTFSYDSDNRLTQIQRPNGVSTSFDYDADGRLTGKSEGTLSSIALTLDAAGKITSSVRDVPLAPTAVTIDKTFSYDAASQANAFSYSASGQVESDSGAVYTWSPRGLLSSATRGSETVQFSYDGLGYRIRREAGASITAWVWSYAHSPAVPMIQKEGGNDAQYHVFTPGGTLVYSIEAATGARTFYHYDERGNTIFTTGGAGAVVSAFAYTPFGAVAAEQNGAANLFTYMGMYGVMREPGSNVYYARARYYHAGTGRFLSRDRLGDDAYKHANRYAFANNNPMQFVDYTGFRPRQRQVQIETHIAEIGSSDLQSLHIDDISSLPTIRSASDFAGLTPNVTIRGNTQTNGQGTGNGVQLHDLGNLFGSPYDYNSLSGAINVVTRTGGSFGSQGYGYNPFIPTELGTGGGISSNWPSFSGASAIGGKRLKFNRTAFRSPFLGTPSQFSTKRAEYGEEYQSFAPALNRRFSNNWQLFGASVYSETNVAIPNGSTAVIGGALGTPRTDGDKVPVLGDTPYLNSLFRNAKVTSNNREVVISITPSLISLDEE